MLFEKIEEGSTIQLEKFMKEAEFKYNFGMNKLVYEPGVSVIELFKSEIFKNIFNLQMFTSYRSHVYKHFKNKKLRSLMEFPVLFLGTMPKDTPALQFDGRIQVSNGTFYTNGGFGNVIDGFVKLCKELSVKFVTNTNVEKINVENNLA